MTNASLRLAFYLVACLLCSTISSAQPRIVLQPYHIEMLPATQSGVLCTFQGKWLVIGGRNNGLHAFQGANIFAEFTQNPFIFVVDPQQKRTWSASNKTLPESIREHISSSNMQWVVRDTILYIMGGYGYSQQKDDFYTWPSITAVRVDSLIDAVVNNRSVAGLFRQTKNELAAVCGGHASLEADGTVSLVFGHRFDGTYNKDTIGHFVQKYTCSIRNFHIDPQSLTISSLQESVDSTLHRRRDYNLVPHFDGSDHFHVAYTGVFRRYVKRPLSSSVEIRNRQSTLIPGFEQQFAHYESAVVPVWDPSTQSQYDYFIGGMAENYYNAQHQLVHDTLVPFVNTLSCVKRESNGMYTETVVDTTFGFMGSNSYFIPNDDALLPKSDGVVGLQPNTLNDVGYVYGGIISPQAHISETNPGLSMASNALYKVLIDTRTNAVATPQSEELALSCYQCSEDGAIAVRIYSAHAFTATLQLVNVIANANPLTNSITLHEGWNTTIIQTPGCASGMYMLQLRSENIQRSAKVVLLK